LAAIKGAIARFGNGQSPCQRAGNGERQRNQGRSVDADDLNEERRALRRLADENPGEPQRAFQRNEMDERVQH
jgi:hypothetical protein